MKSLILAAEQAVPAYPGDELATAAYIMFGVALLIAAIATVIVTPRAEHH